MYEVNEYDEYTTDHQIYDEYNTDHQVYDVNGETGYAPVSDDQGVVNQYDITRQTMATEQEL